MHPYSLTQEQMETQARAKIFWGETPESVVIFLMSYGASNEDAWGIVQQMQAERTAAIRASGVKKLIIGGVLVVVPFVAYAMFTRAGILPIKLFAMTILVGLYGAWKLVNGGLNLAFPESERGDLSEDDDA